MDAGQEWQLVVFLLGKEEYGLPITKVQEINRMVPITRLPHTPDFIEGIINLRERVIPVLDLRNRFQMGKTVQTDDTRIIIADVGGQTVGLMVDAVAEVLHLQADSVEPVPSAFVLDPQYVQGIGKLDGRLLILLTLDNILTPQETVALQAIAE